jgi:hypothetical protein
MPGWSRFFRAAGLVSAIPGPPEYRMSVWADKLKLCG